MYIYIYACMYGCFQKSGTPKSSILMSFPINHPFRGTSIFGNTHLVLIVHAEYIAHLGGLVEKMPPFFLTINFQKNMLVFSGVQVPTQTISYLAKR